MDRLISSEAFMLAVLGQRDIDASVGPRIKGKLGKA